MAKIMKRKLGDLSMDEFMSADIDDSDDSPNSEKNVSILLSITKKKKTSVKKKEKSVLTQLKGKEKSFAKISKHETSQTLADKLKKSDPEFYKFLEAEDKGILDFDVDDVNDDDDEEEEEIVEEGDVDEDYDTAEFERQILDQSDADSSDDDVSDAETGGRIHKLPEKLEVASDDSEAESDAEAKPEGQQSIKVTLKMVKQWSATFRSHTSLAVVREVISAFSAAVRKVGNTTEEEGDFKYKVVGGTVFNAVVRLCLVEMIPALQKTLRAPDLTKRSTPFASKQRSWAKLRLNIKSYLADLLLLFSSLSDPDMLNVLLKHVHKLICMYANFPKLIRGLVKKMTSIWSCGEETSRVLAFLCINKSIRMQQDALLEICIKQMYFAYVKNVKFTSPNTLPLINFMQRSLVEVFLIDRVLTYEKAFIYIRQLAIHLRNAINIKNEKLTQAVYNWQYVHCLELWVMLLSTSHPSDILQPLVYPLVQTIVGTIKLIPSARYYPLRFHCCRCLNILGRSTGTFIPVLPFLLEVFEQTDFNKKSKSSSFKPFNFASILKLSKKQQEEKVFKDGIIDQLYELLLEHFHIHAASIGFPELILPAVLQMKEFLKKCKVSNYCKQIKQIVERIDENAKVVSTRRNAVTFSVSDIKAVDAWERECRTTGTPLIKYYIEWRKRRDSELQTEIAGKDRLSIYDKIPTIERNRVLPKATAEDRKKFNELFDTDSEDSMDDETRFLPKKDRPRKKVNQSEDSDDYSDFDSDELEILARSASEDEDEEDDDVDEDDDNMDAEESGHDAKKKENVNHIPTIDSDEDIEDVVEDFELSD